MKSPVLTLSSLAFGVPLALAAKQRYWHVVACCGALLLTSVATHGFGRLVLVDAWLAKACVLGYASLSAVEFVRTGHPCFALAATCGLVSALIFLRNKLFRDERDAPHVLVQQFGVVAWVNYLVATGA